MRRIVLSVFTIGIVAVMVVTATGAFFTDEETSSGNTFVAGAIDLEIGFTSTLSNPSVTPPAWEVKDLDDELYFDFEDLKPGDWGEGTLELVNQENPAWVCAMVDMTVNSENTMLDQEADAGDTTYGVDGGELGDALEFFWWVDDGDNVFEDDETALFSNEGATMPQIEAFAGGDLTLIDSEHHVFGGTVGEPLADGGQLFMGLGWCFGDVTADPVAQGANDPATDPGFNCDGSNVDNTVMTDKVEGMLSFTAMQARNNMDYLCPEFQN